MHNYEELYRKRTQEICDIRSTLSNLSWDQETMLPAKGTRFRARQMATLASLLHEKVTDPEYGDALEELEHRELDLWDRASVREAKRERQKAVRTPAELVSALAETGALAYEAWREARKNSDFPAFVPWLDKMMGLKRELARCLQRNGGLYETLLDEFEPSMTTARLDQVFGQLQPALTDLVQRIQASPHQPNLSVLRGRYPISEQRDFGTRVLTAMGFDWGSGRLDQSPHPFCSGLSPLDVRITTRYSEEDFTMAFFGLIHEGGHGLYEQGLDPERFGMAACDAISLGIHESQSRLWEIFVARSSPFWTFWYPELQKVFPTPFGSVEMPDFLAAVNRVRPDFIRVEADEVTYGLHVILRYEIERQVIDEGLPVQGLEEVWNQKMESYLGIIPGCAAEGVLQDVHWSHGLVGYFPTYLLGTVYAAQLYSKAQEAIPDLEGQIAAGQMQTLRDWLREKIHLVGKTRGAEELIEAVTDKPLDPVDLLSHLESKFGELYRL